MSRKKVKKPSKKEIDWALAEMKLVPVTDIEALQRLEAKRILRAAGRKIPDDHY